MSLKVIGLGLDGATFDLLLPWFAEGKLPNLKQFSEESARGPLASTIPYMSPPAWTSFCTGVNPGKHGIFDFVEPRGENYDLNFCNAASRLCPSLWGRLSAAGKKVGVINVPMTYPPEEVNGFLISGMEAPGTQSRFAYPPDLYDMIRKQVGEYNMHGDYNTTQAPEIYLQNVFATIDNQVETAKFLLSRFDLDFFFFVFGSTDRIQHFFWKYIDPLHPLYDAAEAEKYGDAIYRVYEAVDRCVGELFSLFPEDSVRFIMSDHGAGPYHKIVHLDRWLSREGLLAFKSQKGMRNGVMSLARSSYLQARKYLPRELKDLLKSKFPQVRQGLESKFLVDHIDWHRTRAFSLGIETTHIYINTTDRFSAGCVAPGNEYEALRRQISARLSELEDPETGEQIVSQVYCKEELFHGPALAKAPDLIVLWKDDKYITRRSYGSGEVGSDLIVDSNLRYGEIGELMRLEQTGTHRRHGIFMIRRPGVVIPGEVAGTGIMDLAPTILHLMGQAVPEDMDGSVLSGILSPEFLHARPVKYDGDKDQQNPGEGQTGRFNPEEEELVRQRLASLGYIE